MLKNDDAIVVRGAREHNLKNINVIIPRNTLTVITGLSGSGKSTLAFDTVYAEGQRRYVESLSNYAKQFLDILKKPEVESIDGLSPTISIQQKTSSHNPRSTVGTVTEIYDHIRLLYARISKAICSNCKKPISSQTAQQMVDHIMEMPEGTKLSIMAPIVRGRIGEYQKELQAMRQKGFSRIRIDGEILDLSQNITLDKQKKHDIDVYIDRLIVRKPQAQVPSVIKGFDSIRARLQESIETALKLSEGLTRIAFQAGNEKTENEVLFSEKYACIDCGISYPTPEPRTFSFNSPMGACRTCDGLGYFAENIQDASTDDNDDEENSDASKIYVACSECKGSRLRPESLCFMIGDKNIAEISSYSIEKLFSFFTSLKLSSREMQISDRILKEIKERLSFLIHVGVDYLSLNRTATTLSGGEAQRIRLATQIGSALSGVTYVLDEPSIGLHQRDNDKLLETLEQLRDLGNTVLVVEHDKDTIERADHVIDLGPGAGVHGGELIAQGDYEDIISSPRSLTGKYLSGKLKIDIPKKRRPVQANKKITIHNVSQNNIKNLTVDFPLETLICVTGVSGSGKSTLILDTLYPLVMHELYKSKLPEIKYKNITGLNLIDKIVDIDQSPIGRTPRSNPATYTGTFSFIRDLFSQLPESRARGFKPGRFSFNVKGGRCEKCQGAGQVKLEMTFLSDHYVLCDECDGKRFNQDTLSIKFKGKSISDVLNLTIEEASQLFDNIPSLKIKLTTLSEVGLGYITLGQSANTLSGGEAQRMKLSRELSKRSTGKTLYILDEPSTGLHFDDVRKLTEVMHKLVDQGNTVIVIEHNLEIIKTSDYILDMGPEGGERGGQIVAQGTPEQIIKNKSSITGKYLKDYL